MMPVRGSYPALSGVGFFVDLNHGVWWSKVLQVKGSVPTPVERPGIFIAIERCLDTVRGLEGLGLLRSKL